MARAGPDVGDCPGYTFPSPRVYKAAIYADEVRIYGIRFLSVLGVSDIGNLRGTPILEEFGPNDVPIGFYGSYNDAGITSLGFLTHDPDCEAYFPPVIEPEPEPEPVIWVPEPEPEVVTAEDEGGSAAGIVLGILIPLILIAAALVGFLLWRRRKNRLGGVATSKPKKVKGTDDAAADGGANEDDDKLDVEMKGAKVVLQDGG